VLDLQEFISGPLNVLPDLVTVISIEKGPQDEHVKRSLEGTDPLLSLLRHRRHSTLNLAMISCWVFESIRAACVLRRET
jgi:hypothetical protein